MLAGKNVVVKAPYRQRQDSSISPYRSAKVSGWEENAPQALVLSSQPGNWQSRSARRLFHIGRKKAAEGTGGYSVDSRFDKQIQTLRQKTHIVTGTPGRVADHLGRESLKLDTIKMAGNRRSGSNAWIWDLLNR